MTNDSANDYGIIFSLETDGSAFDILHEFMDGAGDGADPRGSMILNGSTLYGMTDNGGAEGDGVIFSIGTHGSDFSILHEFAALTDGKDAEGSLTLVGDILYGMTEDGGLTDDGILFSINLDGSDFDVLAQFDESTFGGDPEGSLLHIDGVFYGVTNNGGVNDNGTIFAFNPSVSVPEPSTLAIFALALMGLTSRRFKKQA
ncbi:MAG: PEP-CTERM sorting domain-containing protein [Colwellia sp.]|nr:PEP-CTERM sorting domain-containing protein [Colwellia sp.]